MSKFREIFKYNKFVSIMCIITLLIGIWFYSSFAIGMPIKGKLITFLVSFIPFFVFFKIAILLYLFKGRYKTILKIESIVSSLLLVFYYFIAIFICGIISFANPVTNSKYYNHYVTGEWLERVFPLEIPDTAKNIEFYYQPGFLQAGSTYSLYYVDNNMTMDKFDNTYSSKAVWIGHKEDYTENEGLLSSLFTYTPSSYKN